MVHRSLVVGLEGAVRNDWNDIKSDAEGERADVVSVTDSAAEVWCPGAAKMRELMAGS
jgi:hypothetical protein